MDFKIATSYFYQIRNFNRNLIPVSTAMSDPEWYRPAEGEEYYIDKRGVICGLRYEPLIVQRQCTCICPCEERATAQGNCPMMQEYRQLLETVDFDKMIKGFQHCADKFALPSGEEPIIVLMVHEAWHNPCSERKALQDYFTSHGWECKELEYPIK